MQEYDKSSKWLIQHHGDSILRLAGLDDVAEWRPLQAEVVQPRRLPDGLIEALRRGQSDPGLFVLELATYPEPRIAEQALRDMALVYLDRGVVPEVLVTRSCTPRASTRRAVEPHRCLVARFAAPRRGAGAGPGDRRRGGPAQAAREAGGDVPDLEAFRRGLAP